MGIRILTRSAESRSLAQRLCTLLEIKPGEEKLILLALGATFFHGVSSIYLNSTSHALFLSSFDAKDLAYTYIGGAVTVLLVGAAYGALQHRMPLARLVNFTLAALLLTLLGARLWLAFAPPKGPAAFLAVWTVAFSTLTYMSIWGLFGQIFDTRQAKRLFGLIGAGEFAADIISGCVTPWLVSLVGSINLLYVAGFGLFMSIVFTFLIARTAREHAPETKAASSEPTPPRIWEMLKEAYPRSLHLLWGLSLMAFYLLDTAFSNALERHYGDALDPMTSFLGVFFAVGSAVTMFVETFLSGRFLDRIGIIKALFILPVGVFLFSLSIATGPLYLPQAGMTMFAFAVCCKMFDYVLRNAVHDPAFQVLYQPMPLAKRFAVQSSVLTRAEPMAALLGGGALLLGRFYFEVNLVSVAVLMLVVEAALIGVTVPLGRLYLQALKVALKTRRFATAEDEIKDQSGMKFVFGFLESKHPGEVLYALRLLEKNAPQRLAQRVEDFLRHPAPEVALEAMALAERLRTTAALPEVTRLMYDENAPLALRVAAVRAFAGIHEVEAADALAGLMQEQGAAISQAALSGLLKHCGIEGILVSGERLMLMLKSEDPAQRKAVADILAEVGIPAFFRTLRPLLADPAPEVRRAALVAAEKNPDPRLLPLLLPHLAKPQTRRLACKAIAATGQACLPELGDALSDERLPREIVLGALKAACLIPGQASSAFLVDHLFYPYVEARTLILDRLQRLNHQITNEEEKTLLRQLLDQEANFARQLLRLRLATAKQEGMDLVASALNHEYDACVLRLLALASFDRPGPGVREAQHSLRRGKEKRAYALEMLDALISEEYKRVIFPLLEDASDAHRLERMEKLSPTPATHAPLDLDVALATMAEMRRAWVRPWTRAVAFYAIGQRHSERMAEPMVEAVERGARSSEPLVSETARWAKRRWESAGAAPLPLPPGGEPMLTIEKVLYLKTLELFCGVSEHSLADVASAAEEVEAPAGTVIYAKGDPCASLYAIVSGKARIHDAGKEIAVLGERQAFGLRCALDPHERATSVSTLEHCLLLKIEHEALMELITEDIELATRIIRTLSRLLGGVEDAAFRGEADPAVVAPANSDL